MIARLEMKLSGEFLNDGICQLSSLMQGIMMDYLEPDYAEYLHRQQLRPYNQYLCRRNGGVYWIIQTLEEQAKHNIIDKFLDSNVTVLNSTYKNKSVTISEKHLTQTDYDDLLKQYYIHGIFDTTGNRIFHIRFLTPTSFKQNGQYVIFPSVKLFFQSLMKKYDAFSNDHSCFDEEVLEHYEKYAFITKYDLKSTYFSLEGVKIPSFCGEITIKINGPAAMVNLADMLLQYGSFSGIGIKTAIGMGAITVKEGKHWKTEN